VIAYLKAPWHAIIVRLFCRTLYISALQTLLMPHRTTALPMAAAEKILRLILRPGVFALW
jgi:hypothetical protein